MVDFHADTAVFQPPIDGSFNRNFHMFRVVNEFGNVDGNAATNLARCLAMRSSGKIVNFGGYINPGYVANSTFLTKLNQLGWPADAVLMMDLEHWPGEGPGGGSLIGGNQTAVINDLATKLLARQNGRSELIWLYGNQGDLAGMYPGPRLGWLQLVVASYGGSQPQLSNMRGWQYTDGQPQYDRAGWPSSTSPFGRCDHNVVFGAYPPGGDDMSAAEVAEIKAAIAANQTANADNIRRLYQIMSAHGNTLFGDPASVANDADHFIGVELHAAGLAAVKKACADAVAANNAAIAKLVLDGLKANPLPSNVQLTPTDIQNIVNGILAGGLPSKADVSSAMKEVLGGTTGSTTYQPPAG